MTMSYSEGGLFFGGIFQGSMPLQLEQTRQVPACSHAQTLCDPFQRDSDLSTEVASQSNLERMTLAPTHQRLFLDTFGSQGLKYQALGLGLRRFPQLRAIVPLAAPLPSNLRTVTS